MKKSDIDLIEMNLDALYDKNKISDGLYLLYKTKVIYYRFLLKFAECLIDSKGLKKEGE